MVLQGRPLLSLSLSLCLLLSPPSTTLPASLPSCPCTSRHSVPKKQKLCPDNASLFSGPFPAFRLTDLELVRQVKRQMVHCILFVWHNLHKTKKKQPQNPYSKSVICIVWVNSSGSREIVEQASMNQMGYLYSQQVKCEFTQRDGEKGGQSTSKHSVRLPSCSHISIPCAKTGNMQRKSNTCVYRYVTRASPSTP